MNTLTDIFKSKKTTYRTLEVRDIARLAKGASKGEGLAHFLGHLREVDGLRHVVRCVQENDAVHVSTGVNPIGDIGVIVTELMPADPEALDRRKQRGKIHSGMKRGFIRAGVSHYDALLACGSEAKVNEKGLFRREGGGS